MPVILDGLKRLEYRGYDSAVRRTLGKLWELEKVVQQSPLPGQVGIGHTRWATHGQPSQKNAHPHLSDNIAVVHNGIIENYLKLKTMLTKNGRAFVSETDTEVISHLIAMYIRQGAGYLEAVQTAIADLQGSYALVILNASEPRMLVAARKESPRCPGCTAAAYGLPYGGTKRHGCGYAA